MKKVNDIIYVTTRGCNYSSINSFFENNCILLVEDFFDQKSLLYPNHEEDSAYDLICKKLNDIAFTIKGIVINFNLNGKDCFSIAHHIRLYDLKVSIINSLPIIITHNEELSITKSEYFGVNDYGFFKNNAGYFETLINIINEEEKLSGQIHLYDLINRFNAKFKFDEYLNNLFIPAPQNTTRHQITNEWGARRLAVNAGYSDSEVGYKYPPTLYFKYLKKKFQSNTVNDGERISNVNSSYIISNKLDFKNHQLLKKKNILLIDDNLEKGWKNVLSCIFSESKIQGIPYKMGILDSKNQISIDLNDIDIVFLDLYLPEFQNKIPAKKNGEYILKKIKEKYPHVPVIIFTASNKSWTLNEVIENGADGMYVKESPDFAQDIEYSKGNFKNFVDLTTKTLDKYKVLRPYWESIQTILNSNSFQNIQEKGNSQLKDRIKERLEMFYGLFKRGFEQTKFNQTKFHFSDYELAYMTLWSILNDVSEAFFEKTQPNTIAIDNIGSSESNHPNGNTIQYLNIANGPKHFMWNIKNQSEIFIEYEYKINCLSLSVKLL